VKTEGTISLNARRWKVGKFPKDKRNGHYLDLAEAVREVDLLSEEVHIIKPRATLKEKVINILLPCHPLRKCPYNLRLR